MSEKYPSNSNLSKVMNTNDKSKEVEENIEPIVNKGSTKKQGLFASFFDNLLEDLPKLGKHIVEDIVLPGVKDSLFKTANDTLLAIFHYDNPSSSRTSYSSISSANHRNETTYRIVGNSRSRNSYDAERIRTGFSNSSKNYSAPKSPSNIIFTNKEDALLVRDRMVDIINRVGQVSLTNFYTLVNMTDECTYVTNNWGWKSLAACQIVPVSSDGYVLKLPEPTPLEIR